MNALKHRQRGAAWEQRAYVSRSLGTEPPPLFQEIPFVGCTAHTAFCRDAHTDTHAGTSRGPRGKKHISHKAQELKVKESEAWRVTAQNLNELPVFTK